MIDPYFVPDGVCTATILAPEKGSLLVSTTTPLILDVVTCPEALVILKMKSAAQSKFLNIFIGY